MYITSVNIEKSKNDITYHDRIVLFGSCFSTHLGNKFERLKFSALQNPFGILYNPASIASALEMVAVKKHFTKHDFFQEEDIYKSFHLHSSLAGTNLEPLRNMVNKKIDFSYKFAQKSTWFFITLGTATVFLLKETGEIVANCHKQPSVLFEQKWLTVEQTLFYLEKIEKHIHQLNSTAKIIFTISPVRHFKQGAHANQISKSTLFVAIHQFMQKNPEIIYFPAYEIFNDELRDYRYYAPDMIHPGEAGIEHVWKKFSETYFETETMNLMQKVEEIQKALEHRTFFPESKAYQKFETQLKRKIMQLEKEYPFLKF
jgi:hypothetical protein